MPFFGTYSPEVSHRDYLSDELETNEAILNEVQIFYENLRIKSILIVYNKLHLFFGRSNKIRSPLKICAFHNL